MNHAIHISGCTESPLSFFFSHTVRSPPPPPPGPRRRNRDTGTQAQAERPRPPAGPLVQHSCSAQLQLQHAKYTHTRVPRNSRCQGRRTQRLRATAMPRCAITAARRCRSHSCALDARPPCYSKDCQVQQTLASFGDQQKQRAAHLQPIRSPRTCNQSARGDAAVEAEP